MSVYLDHAATTPLRQEALQVMLPHMLCRGGNPSAMYGSARREREALEEARRTVAGCIGADASEIFFTSGGTESNNWALRALPLPDGLAVTEAEHHAVLDVASHLEKQGTPVRYIGVLPDGGPDMRCLAQVLEQRRPSLLSVIYANNEVGTISPIAQIAALAAERGVPLHTDAVAAAGKLPIDVRREGISLLSAAAHKFGGPRGSGFLFVRSDLEFGSMLFGGRQERGRRPGTEDVAAAAGLAAALQMACCEMERETERLRALRRQLLSELRRFPGIRFNSPADGLPSVVNVCLPGIRSEAALVFLDGQGIECGAGAACSMGAAGASHVLKAMGIPETEAACALRISMGHDTAAADIAALSDALDRLFARHRSRMGT